MLISLLLTSVSNFTLTVISAFTFLAGGLLFYDSWKLDKSVKPPLLRSIGFFLLAASSAFHATSIDLEFASVAFEIARIVGLSLILLSLLSEPILHAPKKSASAFLIPLVLPAVSWALVPLSSALFLLIAATYLRKSTEGYEKQSKAAFVSFLFLGIAEAITLAGYFSNTQVAFLSKLFAEFGPLWIVGHLFELAGIIILATWFWGYIRFRLHLQLFTMSIALSVVIFLSTTIFYTILLLSNIERDTLAKLKTNVSVLEYSLQSLKERTMAQADSIAQDTGIREAYTLNDKETLYSLSTGFMDSQKTSTLIIASPTGEVIMRGEDRDRSPDNVASDPIFAKALAGEKQVTVTVLENVTAPDILIRSAVPLRSGGGEEIDGVVITGFLLDSAFVDGVKAVTGLDITVFGNDKRAATTFLSPDGKSRFIGTIEADKKITDMVLGKSEEYLGKARILNQPFYTAYSPLKTSEGETVGMLFAGQLQNTLTEVIRQSIQLTLLGSIALMIVSIFPMYLFSKFLEEHSKA